MRSTMRFKASCLFILPSYGMKGALKSQLSMASGFSSCKSSISSLLSADQAIGLCQTPSVKFLDASWQLNGKTDLYQEFLKERIPGAHFFDIDKVADHSTDLPHMLPDEKTFSDAVSAWGISEEDHVIIYGRKDTFSAARVWWTFKVFGHEKVSVLNGGLTQWKQAQGPVESGPLQSISHTNYQAKYNAAMVANWEEVLRVVQSGAAQILDARSAARFLGQAPEPRANLPSGHIPGSLSLPFSSVVKEDISEFRSVPEIHRAFEHGGLVMGSDVIFTCGSGVSAAVLCLALHQLGKDLGSMKIYDGSWSEWGARGDLPRMPSPENN